MENVTMNCCNVHYSHKCVDCEHHKEVEIVFKDGIFEVVEEGFECTKYGNFASEMDMKRRPVYTSNEVSGEMARKHINFAIKCDGASNNYTDIVINGLLVHIKIGMNVRFIEDGLVVDGYLHAPTHSGGVCYEDGKPYPSCQSMYDIGISQIEIHDKRTVDMYLPHDTHFFNDWTCCRLEVSGEIWIDNSEEFKTDNE